MGCDSGSVEALTRQFYEWEIRGRGWQVWECPVALEPPFRPFHGHYVTPSAPRGVDDGRRHTALSTFFGGLKSPAAAPPQLPAPQEPEVPYARYDAPLVEIQVALPAETKTTKEAAGQLLLSLGHVSRPVSFEIVGTSESIVVQFACGDGDRRQVREQVQAYFPDAILAERTGYLTSLWDETGNRETAVVDFGLSREFMRPLRAYEKFDPDPLAGLIGAMTDLKDDELAVTQILFSPLRHAWPESILRAVADDEGDSFFADDPAMAKLAAAKIASPLFAAVIRIAAQSSQSKRAWRTAEGIGKSLRQYGDAASNELIPLENRDYHDNQHQRDVVARQSCRSGMILNCEELLSFAHLPSASARSPKLKRGGRRTKAAPALALGHQLVLGENPHAGKAVPVTLGREERLRHMYVIGASGSGKSTLLLNMIAQDIENGEGIAVLDPHGDLVDQVVARIPERRAPDVVLLDPSDDAYPVGFNILSAHSELERNLLASDLVSVFRRLSTSFGDQMHTVLANAILAILESSVGGTLADLRRFLVEPSFRASLLETVTDAEVVYYWQKEFPLLTGKPQGPILTRLDTFLRPKVIRHMVSQRENRVDFGAIMNGRKILLAKLSQGLIGEENSYLLGTLLISKLNQIAMSRQSVAASERKPFYVYVDEFHNFVTPSMAAILAGARKYGLGLILAHQELNQLSNRDGEVASAVIANPYTRVCFRIGDYDAKKLADGFSFFTAKDLQNLPVGEAICRIERAEYDFNLKTSWLSPVAPDVAERRRAMILNESRSRYAAKREAVEDALRLGREAGSTAPQRPIRRETIRVEVPLPTAKAAAGEPIAPLPGRGGEHHKYLQQLIKQWAEARGYSVTVEKPVLDGLGSIDVAMEKGNRRIACEVSVTTDADHETRNVQKCLAAGFDDVILVSSEKATLTAVRHALVAALSTAQYRQVRFLTPEETFSFIESLDAKREPSAAPPDPNEIMTAKEVEELLRIDIKTVYSYVQKGVLPYVKMQSNVRFIRSEILKWMEERQFKPAGRNKK